MSYACKEKRNEYTRRWYMNNPKNREYRKTYQKEYLNTDKGKDVHKRNQERLKNNGMSRVFALRYRYDLPKWFLLSKIINGCQSCGFKPNHLLDIHHLDMDRKNNDTTNIIYVCPNCHAKIHRGYIDFDVIQNTLDYELKKKEMIDDNVQQILFEGGE